jgi:hypothetical protein
MSKKQLGRSSTTRVCDGALHKARRAHREKQDYQAFLSRPSLRRGYTPKKMPAPCVLFIHVVRLVGKCCTLCALVCHRGHNVSYARFSSFFCDCGAQKGGTGGSEGQACTVCKCLSPISDNDVTKAYQGGEKPDKLIGPGQPTDAGASGMKSLEFAAVVARCFKQKGSLALKAAVQDITQGGWSDVVELRVKKEMEMCEQTGPPFTGNGLVILYGDIR